MAALSYFVIYLTSTLVGLLTFSPLCMLILRVRLMHCFDSFRLSALLVVCGLLSSTLLGALFCFDCELPIYGLVVFLGQAVAPLIFLFVLIGESIYMRHFLWRRKIED